MSTPVRIGLVLPDVMGTYGDGGNAVVLRQRLQLRGIDAEIVEITLNDPVPPIQKLSSTKPIDINRPLPQTGNWVGFLKILLKTELDLCDGGDEAKAEILKRFQQITTTGEAKAYMQAKGERLAAVRRT